MLVCIPGTTRTPTHTPSLLPIIVNGLMSIEEPRTFGSFVVEAFRTVDNPLEVEGEGALRVFAEELEGTAIRGAC